MKRNLFYSLLVSFLALTAAVTDANAQLNLDITGPSSAVCGDQVTVEVRAVSGFTDIGSLQFSVNWDPFQLTYVSSTFLTIDGDDPLTGDFSGTGVYTYTWTDSNGPYGATLIPGEVIATFVFQISGQNGVLNVNLTNAPTPIEATDNNFDPVPVSVLNLVSIDNSGVPYMLSFDAPELCLPAGFSGTINMRPYVEITDLFGGVLNFADLNANGYDWEFTISEWNNNPSPPPAAGTITPNGIYTPGFGSGFATIRLTVTDPSGNCSIFVEDVFELRQPIVATVSSDCNCSAIPGGPREVEIGGIGGRSGSLHDHRYGRHGDQL